MTDSAKAPTHMWIVGIASLLWNAFGAFDYVMTKLNNPDYMAAFTPEQQQYFTSFPLWANIGWGLGIWGAVLGSVLLLARSRHAETAFLASLVGLALSSAYQFGLHYADLMRMFGIFPLAFTVVIWAIGIALYLYARRQVAAGVLR
ncbi:MAG: hypothetical protein U0S50_16775 [Sphingopyxis sp.]|uniref:hypothetical protein n=1 Tax=Sphingopyxis sp. TaxID=1908224 RepID=UPI002AB8E28B|nr:hypothetical protein [Sphingopyxis sp.]MDZ3833449.1 hypothetical protein [Sphingopyxis sp.]